MRGIDHMSIVKLISFSESDEHYFLVLERMCLIFPFVCSALTHHSLRGRRALPPNVRTLCCVMGAHTDPSQASS